MNVRGGGRIPETARGRREKVKELFKSIDFHASIGYSSRDQLDLQIKPFIDLLYKITMFQKEIGELPHQIEVAERE